MSISSEYLKKLSEEMTYYRGQMIYYTKSESINVISDNGYEAYGEAYGSRGNVYDWYVSFSDDRTEINTRETSCSCPAFAQYSGLCKHLVAAINILNEYDSRLESDDIGRVMPRRPTRKGRPDKKQVATSPYDKDLIMRYANRTYSAAIGTKTADIEQLPLSLEPSLKWDKYEGPRVTFRVGAGKLFVVKDVGELKTAIATGSTMSFGSNTELLMERSCFNESDRKLVDFINIFAERKRGNDFRAEAKKEISLAGTACDAFFAAFDGRYIKIDDQRIRYNRDKYKLEILKVNPRIPIVITRIPGGIKVSTDALEDESVFRSGQTGLIFKDHCLYVCDTDYTNACQILLRQLSQRTLTFADEDIASFFSVVMSQAQPYLDVRYSKDDSSDYPEDIADEVVQEDVADELETFMAPPLVTKVYFDIDEDDSIRAKMLHYYGDLETPAFGKKTLENNCDIRSEVFVEKILLSYMRDMSGIKYADCAETIDNGTVTVSEEDRVFELLAFGIPELSAYCEIYTSDEFGRIKVRPPASVAVGVSVSNSLLDMEIDIEGIDFEDLAHILSQYRRKKKYTRLSDGSFLPIEDGDAVTQLAELAEGMELTEAQLRDGHFQLGIEKALYIDSILKGSEALRYKRDEAFRSIIRALRNVEDADIDIPQDLVPILRNYQTTGVKWLSVITDLGFGGILADDMGLGKTLEVLTYLKRRKDSGAALPSIVVCPASLVLNWAAEAARFTPELNVCALVGTKSERLAEIRAGNADVYVSSYGQVLRDIESLGSIKFECAILDEAQFVKNQTSKSAKAVKSIESNVRLALTGTPVENTLAELWSIFDFVMPGYLNTYGHFRDRYETPIAKNGDEKSTQRLRALTSPFVLRRLKGDVLKELPEKVETVLPAHMEGKQRKVYTAMLAQVKAELADRLEEATGGQGRMAILAAITRLRQICCDPALIYENYDGESAKLDACLELVESCIESGHRILLFSQFTSMLAIIKKRLDKEKITYSYLDGATPKKDRIDLMNAFNESDETKIFLISLKAGGTGLNLTGADIVIHYDPWWNLSVQNQATDRAHRIGQTRRIQVYSLIVKETIEEKIIELQQKKAALAKSVLEGVGAFERLTDEELLSLLTER